jgi:hypothetical protein
VGIGLSWLQVSSCWCPRINNEIKMRSLGYVYRQELERLLRDPRNRQKVLAHPAVDFANRSGRQLLKGSRRRP